MNQLTKQAGTAIVMLMIFSASFFSQNEKSIMGRHTHGWLRFGSYCAPNSRTLWTVGGYGQIIYTSEYGRSEYKLPGELNGVYANAFGRVWLVGEDGAIYYSASNGNYWSRQRSGVDSNLKAIICVNNECWATGGQNTIIHTKDGGSTWTKVKLGLDIPDVGEHRWNAVEFIDARTGWIAGDDGIVVHTDDGGRTWSRQQASILHEILDYQEASNINAIKFVDQKHGWMCAWGGMCFTNDSGRSWHLAKFLRSTNLEEEVDPEILTFIGIVTQNGRKLWAIGNEDTPNYCSEDAGRTWNRCKADDLST